MNSAEIRPWIGRPPYSEPPDISGLRLIGHDIFSIMRVSLFGLVLMPVWLVIFGVVYALTGGSAEFSFTFGFVSLWIVVFVIFATGILHEIVHAVPVMLFGGKPSFGAGPGYLYTTFEGVITRMKYMIVIVAPGVVINAGCLVLIPVFPDQTALLLLISTFNASGLGGDAYMIVKALRYPRDTYFADLANGFAVYETDRSPSGRAQATTANRS